MTDTLAERIAAAHQAPEGFAEINHVANPLDGEPVSLTDIIRELQARLAVASRLIGQLHEEGACRLVEVEVALTACDLSKPFGEGE